MVGMVNSAQTCIKTTTLTFVSYNKNHLNHYLRAPLQYVFGYHGLPCFIQETFPNSSP